MRIPLIVAMAASVACGADRATGVPASTTLQGLWLLNYSLASPELGASCVGGGQVVLETGDDGFTGSSHSFSRRCVSPRDTTMVWTTVTINDGRQNGANISFTDGRGCAYTGTMTVSRGPEIRITGQVVCSTANLSPVYSGSWTAMRPLPD